MDEIIIPCLHVPHSGIIQLPGIGGKCAQRDNTRQQQTTDQQNRSVHHESLQEFVGQYSFLGNEGLAVRLENSALLASRDGKQWTELLAETEDMFFMKEDDIKIVFKRNEAGQVIGFDLLIQGVEMPGEKNRAAISPLRD